MDGFTDEAAMHRAHSLAERIEGSLSSMRHGRDLEADPLFLELVALLSDGDAGQRVRWLARRSDAMHCATLAAMAAAGDRSHAQVASMLDRLGYYAMHFALGYLGAAADAGLADTSLFGRMLLRTPAYLGEWPSLRAQFFDVLWRMQAAGLAPTLAESDGWLDWTLEERRDALAEFDLSLVTAFVAQLEQVDRSRRLKAAGADFAYSPEMCRRLSQCDRLLSAPGQACLLLVGDAGSGRGALARTALRALSHDGWTVVEASPKELLAGLQHVHPIEERIATLVAGLSGDRQIWHATCWFQLLEPPSEDCHRQLLELLWPYLRDGLLQVVGSASGHNLQRAIEDLPDFHSTVHTMEILPLSAHEARTLVQDWALRHSNRHGAPVIDAATLEAALQLAAAYAPRRAEPGRTLGILEDALDGALADNTRTSLPLDRDAILRALARRSGLSAELLDAVCRGGASAPKA
jgi:hypothetical protein